MNSSQVVPDLKHNLPADVNKIIENSSDYNVLRVEMPGNPAAFQHLF